MTIAPLIAALMLIPQAGQMVNDILDEAMKSPEPVVEAAPSQSPTPAPVVPPEPKPEPKPEPPKRYEALLACIRSYEQGAAGYATNTGNGYYGAYQFNLPTWRSVDGTGLPSNASAAEQDRRAIALYESRGLQPWPSPQKRC